MLPCLGMIWYTISKSGKIRKGLPVSLVQKGWLHWCCLVLCWLFRQEINCAFKLKNQLSAFLQLLKRFYNLGDETIMAQWLHTSYFQYFCGEAEFQWDYKLLVKVIQLCIKLSRKGISAADIQPHHEETIVKTALSPSSKTKKEARTALRKLKTIAGRLVRELEHTLDAASLKQYEQQLNKFNKVIA